MGREEHLTFPIGERALHSVAHTTGVPLIYYSDEVGMPGAGDPDNRRFMQCTNYSAGQASLLLRMKVLGSTRAAHSALRRGARTTLVADDDVWVYSMVDGKDTVYVALNRSDNARTVSGLPNGAALKDLISGDTVTGPMVTIPARGVRLLPAS